VGSDDPRSLRPVKRTTSNDVAVAAGLSRATASYVLNGADEKHRIAPATRNRQMVSGSSALSSPPAVRVASFSASSSREWMSSFWYT
jgi:Bacterial regulatory proteins, lacI family